MAKQFVLAVPRERLGAAGLQVGFNPAEQAHSLVSTIYRYGEFLPRSRAESDQQWLQPIPCGLIHCGGKILTLERREHSKRHALNRMLVLWAGGHVDFEDKLTRRNGHDLLVRSLQRELDEELCIETGMPSLQGIVATPGSLHFGVIYDVPSVAPASGPVDANDEFRIGRHDSPSGYFLEIRQLRDQFNRFEPWSKAIYADVLGLLRPVDAMDPSHQLSFVPGLARPVPVMAS